MRTHVILRDELVEEIDRLVGKRKRSKFMEEAIEERLRREALAAALEKTAGMFKAEVPPEWDTPQKVSDWVKQLRVEETKRLEKKLQGLALSD